MISVEDKEMLCRAFDKTLDCKKEYPCCFGCPRGLAFSVLGVINLCSHAKTVAINEEGHSGIYCSDCGEQLEKEC